MKYLSLFLILIFVVSCKSPQPREPITKTSGHFIKRSIKRNKKLEEKQEKQIEAIIKKDTANQYFASNSGFWYRYDKKINNDSLNSPEFGDLVIFDYDIATLDGRMIYSKKELSPRDYLMDKEDAIAGLRLGLKLMKEGETMTFYIPSYQAYGYYGDKNKIGANLPIRTTVTLNSIQVKNDTITKPFIKH